MTSEELKALIQGEVKNAVNEQIEPLKETQRKYADLFDQGNKGNKPTQESTEYLPPTSFG